MKTTMKRALLAAVIVTSFMMAAPAQSLAKKDAPVAELKMTGKHNDHPVFQLEVNGAAGDRYYIVITDQDGDVLYDETARGGKISRTFRLNTDELTASRLTVEITSRKTAGKTSFEIVNTMKQIFETTVTGGAK